MKAVRGFSFSREKCLARNSIFSLLFVLIKGRTTSVVIKVETVRIANVNRLSDKLRFRNESLYFFHGFTLVFRIFFLLLINGGLWMMELVAISYRITCRKIPQSTKIDIV